MPSTRVAIVQAAPVPGDSAASVDKLVRAVRGAASEGARLVVCGETWLGGYPAWIDHCAALGLWGHEPVKQAFAAHRRDSVTIPGPETRALAALTAELGIWLVVGANERVEVGPGNRTLFNVLLVFGDGRLVVHHRKLVPTHTERLIWGPGDGVGLRAVDTGFARVGGLICWEHMMPLARQAMHEQGEHIHVALWPTVTETHRITSRQYAFEGRCFVLAAGSIARVGDVPASLRSTLSSKQPDELLLRGGSCAIGPDGAVVTEPVFDREHVVVVDLDLDAVDREAMTLDVTGHYARPDVFSFSVHRRRPAPADRDGPDEVHRRRPAPADRDGPDEGDQP